MKHTLVCTALALLVALASGCQKKSGDGAQSAHDADSAAAAANAPLAAEADTLASGPWAWVATQTPVERIAPSNPENYTVAFMADSAVAVQADCNRGHGSARVEGQSIRFGAIATTRMMCPPGSLDTVFLQELDAARHWFMNGDTLMVDLFADSGTMRFVRTGGAR